MKVEQWPIERITPYARNPRRNADAVDKVAASLKEYGFRQPIVVDKDGVIVVGHTRLMAARKLGLEAVPVHVAEGLSKQQIKAYRLADNRVHEASAWDYEMLPLELGELEDEGFDLALTGFDDAELANLLGSDDGVDAGQSNGEGAGSLSSRFGVPPFSVLNAREGWWQDRKRAWIGLGIQSELGRGEQLIENGGGDEQQAPLRAANATPGGALMPACDYRRKQRGDGRGRAIDG